MKLCPYAAAATVIVLLRFSIAAWKFSFLCFLLFLMLKKFQEDSLVILYRPLFVHFFTLLLSPIQNQGVCLTFYSLVQRCTLACKQTLVSHIFH